MEQNGVGIICISLSSHSYYEEFQSKLRNTNAIIYASYNNKRNTYDYPAMYENVIGVGTYNSIVNIKESDIIYKSNKILFFKNGIKYYKGNSFLALYEAIKAR